MRRFVSPWSLLWVVSCAGQDAATPNENGEAAGTQPTTTGSAAPFTSASAKPQPNPQPSSTQPGGTSSAPGSTTSASAGMPTALPSGMNTAPTASASAQSSSAPAQSVTSEPSSSPSVSSAAPDAGASPPPAVGCGASLDLPVEPEFACGDAHIFENNGPPSNRVNYVIVGDGYTAAELDTALLEHVENMLYNADTGMFSEIGEPYTRYRKFINICALRTASNDSGVDGPGGNPDRDTVFGGGNCGDRLGCVDDGLVFDFLADNLPEHVDADWVAATMNENEWWNSGGRMMVWSGKFMETSPERAASVALHEGGHAFHQLADEYGDENLNCDCGSAREPNVSCETESGMSAEDKWGEWIGYVMEGGSELWNLGEHGAIPGGRYCGEQSGITRPTRESEMNILPYAHNMPSIQKAIHDIYEIVRPIDAHTPNTETVEGATELLVRVVDAEVIQVEWSVDGEVSNATRECFDLSSLSPGEHTVTARAYDATEWVRDNREDLEQEVQWTVLVP